MAGYGAIPPDANTIPMGCAVVPGTIIPRPIKGGAPYTDANGNILAPVVVQLEDGAKATYSATFTALAGVVGIVSVLNYIAKVAKLTRVELVGTATAATLIKVALVKYSALLNGGTALPTPAVVPYGSNN